MYIGLQKPGYEESDRKFRAAYEKALSEISHQIDTSRGTFIGLTHDGREIRYNTRDGVREMSSRSITLN